jgi:Zn-dependent protease/CBS domain-containing protein
MNDTAYINIIGLIVVSLNIGKILGIKIKIHYTWLIIFFLISWSLATGYIPLQFPGLSDVIYWIIGIISAISLFVSVLVHELAHSYVALKQGIEVPNITLFLFGGVSQIAEEPESPNNEAKMALVGPLSSFAISALFVLLWFVAVSLDLGPFIIAPFSYIAIINALLGGFNFLPAFPLDGGRVLRAGLWKWKNNLIAATKISIKITEVIAYIMIGAGFIMILLFSLFTGLWIVFIGWFLKNGSEASLKQTLISQALSDVKVKELMNSQVVTISSTATIADAFEQYFANYTHSGFPVIKNEKIQGIITFGDFKNLTKEKRQTTLVRDVMTPREKLILVSPDEPAVEAMLKLSKNNIGRLPVLKGDKLVGIITRSDLMKAIRTRIQGENILSSEAFEKI